MSGKQIMMRFLSRAEQVSIYATYVSVPTGIDMLACTLNYGKEALCAAFGNEVSKSLDLSAVVRDFFLQNDSVIVTEEGQLASATENPDASVDAVAAQARLDDSVKFLAHRKETALSARLLLEAGREIVAGKFELFTSRDRGPPEDAERLRNAVFDWIDSALLVVAAFEKLVVEPQRFVAVDKEVFDSMHETNAQEWGETFGTKKRKCADP